MNTLNLIIGIVFSSVFVIFWLYIAARVITRGVIRTLHERKMNEKE
jgi:predicted membrane protein